MSLLLPFKRVWLCIKKYQKEKNIKMLLPRFLKSLLLSPAVTVCSSSSLCTLQSISGIISQSWWEIPLFKRLFQTLLLWIIKKFILMFWANTNNWSSLSLWLFLKGTWFYRWSTLGKNQFNDQLSWTRKTK